MTRSEWVHAARATTSASARGSLSLALTLALAMTAALFAGLGGEPRAGALPAPPSQWKGVNYFPAGYYAWNMLNSWSSVQSAVDSDMATMAANGVNFLHLYLWDSDWGGVGFNPMPKTLLGTPYNPPNNSPNGQWAALDSFLSLAESHGLYVGLHFVSKYPIDTLNGLNGNLDLNGAAQMGDDFATWANTFVSYFTPRHQNIALWGVTYALGPVVADPPLSSTWNVFFAHAYGGVYQVLRGSSSCQASGNGLGLIGINLGLSPQVPAGGFNYSWNTSYPQQAAAEMSGMGVCAPDIYMLQLYNAHSDDLAQMLTTLSTSPAAGGIAIPANQILAVEYATSSSMAAAPYGNGVASFGDSYTPTTDTNGQAQWLTNTLCAFARTGVQKTAYFGYYDASSFYSGSSPADVAWPGYFGFFPLGGGAAKPAWPVLSNYFTSGALACSPPQPPLVQLQASTTYVGAGYPVQLTWTASEVRQLQLSGVGNLTPSNVDSCASLQGGNCEAMSEGVKTVYPPTPGTATYTLTGINSTSQSYPAASAQVTITVSQNPVVAAVTDSNYQSTLYADSTIVIWGSGFTATGGNTVQLQRPGYADVWLYEGDGHYYWDQSTGQINSSLDNRAAPGPWTVTVRDATSAPSYPFNITIN
jgi:hypothetical protein